MIRILVHAFVSIALSGMALPASAADDPAAPAWEGVWRGTIGTLPVVACLRMKDDLAAGLYYYEKHLIPINIAAPEQSATGLTLSETQTGDAKQIPSLWKLALPVDGQMNGTWSGAGKHLPIHLKKIVILEPDNDEGPCASADFNGPRERPARVVTTSASKDGTDYRELRLDFGKRFDASVSSFQLQGAGNAHVNAQLRDALTAEEENVYTCTRSSLAQYGQAGEYNDTTAPMAIMAHWLVTERSNSNMCGGVHPNASTTHDTWNLATGKKVDVWDWFSPAGAVKVKNEADTSPKISTRLQRLLARAWADSVPDDCKDASSGYWTPYPTSDGMAFTPSLPHVVYACTTDVVIPYAKLAPLLNTQGKAAVASFRADARPSTRH